MNKAIVSGRLTKEPDIRYTGADGNTAVARFTLAVDRRFHKEGEPTADFIPCVAFGKIAELIEKYVKKGTKINVAGRIQTGSYTNRDGQKVYTTDVMVEEMEFAESKGSGNSGQAQASAPSPNPRQATTQPKENFMDIPAGIDEELPFN